MKQNNNFDTKNYIYLLNKDNVHRLRTIAIIMSLIVSLQALLYLLSNSELYNMSLIITKIVIAISGIIAIFVLSVINQNGTFFKQHSEKIIVTIVMIMLLLSIISTFIAQNISSDISIYIMILFAIIAAVRLRPLTLIIILITNYIVFVIGLPHYQTNPTYLFAHIINGTIMNIIAFAISKMFYNYSMQDYLDKLSIDAKNSELKLLSQKDGLTGLYNQRSFNDLLKKYINTVKETDETLYLGVLDVDHFKTINDYHGHVYGDEILKLLAEKIMNNLRPTDIAGRYGGDEFVIIFKGLNSTQVLEILKRLRNEVNQIELKDRHLSFSCGIAKWEGEPLKELVKKADQYMYTVKTNGRNDIYIGDLPQ